jgi:hypothetical protein
MCCGQKFEGIKDKKRSDCMRSMTMIKYEPKNYEGGITHETHWTSRPEEEKEKNSFRQPQKLLSCGVVRFFLKTNFLVSIYGP